MVESISVLERPSQGVAIEAACSRVPPLWPLQNFVAVNPFLGLSGQPFEQAARLMERTGHSDILMDSAYYLEQLRTGAISSADIRAVLSGLGAAVIPADPSAWLNAKLRQTGDAERIFTVADWLDQSTGTAWAAFVVEEISKWCSSYFDSGQSSWAMPWRDLSLYEAWKSAGAIDANPEVYGLPAFRRHVSQLPDSPDAAIEHALSRLNVPQELASDFLHRQLMSVFGWSAYAAYQDREGAGGNHVRQLLAIRLAYDTALLPLARGWQCQVSKTRAVPGWSDAKYIAQLATELAFRDGLGRKLQAAQIPKVQPARKTLQAVFCIDVRSEVYRRALESQSPEIETVGFAGFFGMSLAVGDSARCPVLIKPRHAVHSAPAESALTRLSQFSASAWKGLSTSASACFSAVEAGGAWFGLRMILRAAKQSNRLEPEPELAWRIPPQEQVDLAAGALKNMCLDPSRLARVVLICGHGSVTENNPYGSSLDCGACGGHKGDVNARVAAELLNSPVVREGLANRGINVPADTVFIAGLHVTTTDDVLLYGGHPALSHDQKEEILCWLTAASRAARTERARLVSPAAQTPSEEDLDREIQRRGADWSEVRPEWGLAGNAAFVAAPRSRTRHLNLAGRVFLHEYDQHRDQDASVLELILAAPVVVASWINLQYFGSTVNNALFGSGNKVLHNVVGTFGVWEGNGGDLRTGLPLQSLHDGARWVHQPLRLQVFVEAPRTRIDKVLAAHPEVRELIENNWIHLSAMEGDCIYECLGLRAWRLAGEGTEA